MFFFINRKENLDLLSEENPTIVVVNKISHDSLDKQSLDKLKSHFHIHKNDKLKRDINTGIDMGGRLTGVLKTRDGKEKQRVAFLVNRRSNLFDGK